MAFKCRICGINEVSSQGDICDLCAIGQDPYAQNQNVSSHSSNASGQQHDINAYSPKRSASRKVLLGGGAQLSNRDPYGNDMTETDSQSDVKVYSPGQVPNVAQSGGVAANSATSTVPGSAIRNQPATEGITKNISTDNQKTHIIIKWFRALFGGVPFTLDDDVTMFQVFPDFTGTAVNAQGNACDQVIVYGKLNNGAVSENNDVEVYGHRDANNNIIAKQIRNKASGTTITPSRTIGQGTVWFVTLAVVAVLVTVLMALGIEGIVWVAIIILCVTNLPLVFKIVGVLFGAIFSFLRRLIR